MYLLNDDHSITKSVTDPLTHISFTHYHPVILSSSDSLNTALYMCYKRCGYEVPGMILLLYLNGVLRVVRSSDMSVHVSTCTN